MSSNVEILKPLPDGARMSVADMAAPLGGGRALQHLLARAWAKTCRAAKAFERSLDKMDETQLRGL